MHIRRKPKSIAVLFIGGTSLLFGGAAVAASLSPSGARMLHMTAAHGGTTSTSAAPSGPSAAPSPATSTHVTATPKPKAVTTQPSTTAHGTSSKTTKTKTTKAAAAKAPITYIVRPGDTLSGIAAWFKLHGYGSLYAANAKTIGANPNLIQPGTRITIGTHLMKVQGPA